MEFPREILQRLETGGVVAGVSVDRVEQAVPLSRALLAGGIDAIELVLRTSVAMEAVARVCSEVPELLVGVGTILTPETAREVKEAGAHFGVSPGMNPRVIRAAQEVGLPFAPGICTPSDLEGAIEQGCRFVKFFPAEASGGLNYLRNMGAPYRHLDVRYFPLGGIHAGNMLDYLGEDNVPTVGGSWIAKKELVTCGDWEGITARAAEVRGILRDARRSA
jgi:2-dehydro-3-deoxyphosphogluconate aldolase/(4S)-4-hydroxy-2-oxoglutarate aldolase